MDDLARWAWTLLGFSSCYDVSQAEQLMYAGGFLLIAFGFGILVVGLVLGWFSVSSNPRLQENNTPAEDGSGHSARASSTLGDSGSVGLRRDTPGACILQRST